MIVDIIYFSSKKKADVNRNQLTLDQHRLAALAKTKILLNDHVLFYM